VTMTADIQIKVQGTKVPRSDSFIERTFPGAKRLGSERTSERKGQ